MKIKVLAAAFVFAAVTVTGARALGLGAQFNFSAGGIFAPGVALAVSPSDSTHLAFNWFLDFDKVNIIGLTADVAPVSWPITSFSDGSLNFTLGLGVFANLLLGEGDLGFNGGGRIPVGLNLRLGRNSAFELYTHVAPSFGIRLLPGFGFTSPFFPVALGARLWFG